MVSAVGKLNLLSFVHFSFNTCARQAQQAQLGTYRVNQLSLTNSVMCQPQAIILDVESREVNPSMHLLSLYWFTLALYM